MILRCRPVVASLALLCAVAGFCASASAQSSGPPQAPTPKYKAIIAKSLRVKDRDNIPEPGVDYFKGRGGIFSAAARLDHVEIADSIRMVQTNYYGWAWQTCLRLNVNGFPLTYAVFISENRVVDARSAVAIDNCQQAKYSALPAGAGATLR
jgi:hypothetical protein